MIKVNNLNKFYNKNKSNEIHVINNISLEFNSTGLVCLLGPSGSGKTTLLNTIGGLDKVDNGSIEYLDDILNKYKSNDWDFIRNKHVGYIFQNYNLLNNLSVYDNVMFTLKMTNLNKEECHNRVMYALTSVGIEKYYKRKVTQLSGGQQQRVAIARALAKSPNVIIADEPTGNLDEKNTTIIMNILKRISEKTLVILVTHEERIAKFYASRIIRLADGKIVGDEINNNKEDYVYSDDNNIYLKDLNKEELSDDSIKVNYFFDKQKVDVNLNVVFKNGIFYIESLSNQKIQVLTNDDEIKIVDDFKPTLDKQNVEEFVYDLQKISDENYKRKSNIKFKDTFSMAFKRIIEMKRRQKLVFLGFMLSAFLFVMSCSSMYSSSFIDESSFIRSGYNEFILNVKTEEQYTELSKLGILYEQLDFEMQYDGFLQGEQSNAYFSISSHSVSQNLKSNVKNQDIILGEFGDFNDILVDKMVLDTLLNYYQFYKLGFDSYDDFIGLSVNEVSRISGVVDKNTPEVYTSKSMFSFNWKSFIALDSEVGINVAENNVYVSNRNINIGNAIMINNLSYNVSGYTDVADYVFNEVDFEVQHKIHILENTSNFLLLHAYDNNEVYDYLSTQQLVYYNVFDNDLENYKELTLYNSIIFAILAILLVVTSLVFLYFIMRSSLISRVYDIGVYRSLGITKTDIRKIFISEITLISLCSSFIGYMIAISIVYNFGQLLGLNLSLVLYIPILFIIIGLNVLIGLKPINNLLKLTPSEIGSKYDI